MLTLAFAWPLVVSAPPLANPMVLSLLVFGLYGVVP